MKTRLDTIQGSCIYLEKKRWWLVRTLIMLVGLLLLWQPTVARADEAAGGCLAITCVSSGPQLADVDSTQSELLDAVLGNLLGVDLDLDAAEANSLLHVEIGTEALLETVAEQLGLASIESALTVDITLEELLTAVGAVLDAEGETEALGVIHELIDAVELLPATIQLGDLLVIDTPDNSLGNITIDVLDLVTGAIQLYSFDNMVGASVPVTIPGNDLGLEGTLVDVTLQAYIIEPPVIVCGTDGTTFHSAALRIKLGLDLLDVALDTSTLEAELLGSLTDLLGVLGINVEIEATLAQLDLYAEVARGNGTISLVDAIQQTVNIEAAPGAVDLYLGSIDDALFFNRSAAVAPADVDFAPVASLAISVTNSLPIVFDDIIVAADVGAKAVAQGGDGTPEMLIFSGPYPQTLSTATSATFATNLIENLLSTLELEIDTSLGSVLDPLVDTLILPALKTLLGSNVSGLLGGILDPILTNLVDPLFELLGTDLGVMNITVLGINQLCPDLGLSSSHTGPFARGGSGTYLLGVTNSGSLTTTGPITLVNTLPVGISYLAHAGDDWNLHSVDGQNITFTRETPLAVDATSDVQLTVSVAGTTADSVVNSAVVSTLGDPNPTNNTTTHPTTITGIDPDGDADDDCVPNSVEDLNGNGDYFDDDTDADTIPNFMDADDDGDSLHTCTVEDEDGDGDPTNDDTDGDGTPNYLDPDDDDDTVPTIDEDPNGNNDPTDDDTDNDGTPNYLDPDDDGDTVPTEDEDPNGNGDPQDDDTDDDGTPDYLDPDDDSDTKPTKDEDPNSNGNPQDDDSDGDGMPDYLDPDDDNDGIPDSRDNDDRGNVFLPLINRS